MRFVLIHHKPEYRVIDARNNAIVARFRYSKENERHRMYTLARLYAQERNAKKLTPCTRS